MQLVFKNFADAPCRTVVTDRTGRLRAATVVDLLGHAREPLAVTTDSFTVEMPPNALVFVAVDHRQS
jgi:hypothetical protein